MDTDILQWQGARHFSLDPKAPAFYQNPYHFYQLLHERGGPLYWQQYGMWCLCGFDEVNNCLRDRRFARLPPAGFERKPYASHLAAFAAAEKYSLLALEPPQHTRLRKLVNRAFVSSRVEAMSDEITAIANRCIDQFVNAGEVELLSAFATPLPVTVIARLLGVPESSTDQLLAWSHAMVKVYTMTQTRDDELAANRASAAFISFLQEQIELRRHTPGDDLLSTLVVQQQQGNGASDEEIVSVAILLLNAGHEATVHQIGNSVVSILKHPPPDPQWFNTVGGADRVVTECLRHDAPLHLFTRFAQEPVQLCDEVVIEAGTEIALLLGAANHCPVRFQAPAQFDDTRDNNQHVSLGAGLHFCVGAPLARLELRLALSALFRRLPGLRLSVEPNYSNSFHFHGLESLHVSWDV